MGSSNKYYLFDNTTLDFLVDAMPLVKFCKVYRYRRHIDEISCTETKYALYDFKTVGVIPVFMAKNLDDDTLIVLALKGLDYSIVHKNSNIDSYIKSYLHE